MGVHEVEIQVEIQVEVVGQRGRVALNDPADRIWVDALVSLGVSQEGPLWFNGERVDLRKKCGPVGLVRGGLLTDVEPHRRQRVEAVVAVRVLTGPAAGTTLPLALGTTSLGRAHLADPSVSIRHVAIYITGPVDATGPSVFIADLGSTNGTAIDRVDVGPEWSRVELNSAAVVSFGRCLVRFEMASPLVDRCSLPEADGTIRLRRAPRLGLTSDPTPLVAPGVVYRSIASRLRISTLVLPVLLAIVMVSVTGQATFALFALLSPLTMLGTHLEDRRTNRKRGRRSNANRESQYRRFADAAATCRANEQRRRFDAAPDLATLVDWPEIMDSRLWSRRRGDLDGADVVIGYGRQTWAPPVQISGDAAVDVLEVISLASDLGDVPLVISLIPGRWIGICGDRDAVNELATSVILQTAILRSGVELRLVVANCTSFDTSWTRWLPHLIQPGEDLNVADSDRAATLALVDLRSSKVDTALPSVAEGATVLVLADSADRLPALCDLVVTLHGDEAVLIDVRLSRRFENVLPVSASDDLARRTARALAAYVDVDRIDPASSLPATLRLATLLQIDVDGDLAAQVEARWIASNTNAGLAVDIGATASGPLSVDLVSDGPHALVAGTTGSGKSELLRSWLLALASTYSPDVLNFVLIDYKGGSAFAACAALPHTAGLVTDLDGHLASRALRCLDAEIVRREHVLRDAGAIDLTELLKRGGALPRLVVVIDEFATLAAEVPGFLDALVGVAQRGRSLGIHLVLATQRPSGAVSENIRANTNLRIALRVQTSADSVDVIGDAAGARLPRLTPGRAIIRLGPTEFTTFQAAYSGAAATPVERPAARWLDEPFGERPVSTCTDKLLADDVADLVDAARKAAAQVASARPHRPWPDPLPSVISLDALGDRPLSRATVPFGVVDLPDEQRWGTLAWTLDDGPLLLIGPIGGGVTTALTTLAMSACERTGGADLHLHVIDYGTGGLAPLTALPQSGDVLGVTDGERLRRLSRWFGQEMARRREVLQREGVARWTELDDGVLPRVLLLIDQYPALRADLDASHGQPVLDVLHRLFADGTALGIHVAIGVDRLAAVPIAVVGSFNQRVVLGARDRFELVMAGAKVDDVPPLLPGRGVDVTTSQEVQIAMVRGPLASAVADLSDWTWGSGEGRPYRSPVLPIDLSANQFAAMVGCRNDPRLMVGLGDRDVCPIGFDVGEGDGIVVVGPARSGRSLTLASMARTFAGGRQVFVVCPRRSPLKDVGSAVIDPDASMIVATVTDVLSVGESVALFIDDAESLDDPTRALERLLASRPLGLNVFIAGRADAIRSAYGHWTAQVRRTRMGIALRPNLDTDGDVFGLALPRRIGPFPPGRGCLVRDGEVEVIQIPYG